MKKLVIIINSAKFFISHRLILGERAANLGYEVHLICPIPDKDSYKILHNKPFKIHYLGLSRSGKNIITELKSFLALLYLLITIKPDLVHLITIKPVLYGGFIARVLRIPALIAISGLGYMYSKNSSSYLRGFSNFIYRFVLSNKKSKVILQNNSDRLFLREIKATKENQDYLLPGSGVDLGIFTPGPHPKNHVTFLLPSRMLWEKGVGDFVEAAKIIKSHFIEARFILAGPFDPLNPSGVPLDYLEELNNNGVVEWLGDYKEMPALYQESSVVVLPTYYNEGLPKVLLEASASGRAIITTNMPGCEDVVDDGINGLFVRKQDPVNLAELMKYFLINRDAVISMGRLAREKAVNYYDVEIIANKHMEIYEELSEL